MHPPQRPASEVVEAGHGSANLNLRGGMIGRVYIVRFASKTIRAWTYEMPDGKLEQFQVAVVGN